MAVTSLAQNNPVPLHNNYVTGYFGTGRRVFIPESTTFVAPISGKYRVRLWGGGSSGYVDGSNYRQGHSGGFAIKEIELTEGQEVPVVVAQAVVTGYSQSGESSSFGAFVSATGATGRSSTDEGESGDGVGGDLNVKGVLGMSASSTGYSVPNGLAYLHPFLARTEFISTLDLDIFERLTNVTVSSGKYHTAYGGYVIVEY